MIIELSKKSIQHISGGDAITTIGGLVGAGLAEVQEHPFGAMFGVVGIVVAHYATREK